MSVAQVSLTVRPMTIRLEPVRMAVTAEVRDAAHNALESELALLGVPEHTAAVILASTALDHVLGQAFAAARAEVDVKLSLALESGPAE